LEDVFSGDLGRGLLPAPQKVKPDENALFRISVILQRSCRMTLEELSRVSQAMAIQSYLLCFFYRQAGE
jgi:hypothetical protein